MSTINRTYMNTCDESTIKEMVDRWNCTYAIQKGKLISYEYDNGEFFITFTHINTGFSLPTISVDFFKQYGGL